MLGSWEWGNNLIQARAAHSQQEFYGATPEGKLGLMDFNRGSFRYRRLREERYRLDASYGSAYFRDRNRLGEADVEAVVWIPFARMLSANVRFQHRDYARPDDRYDSIDSRGVWVGGQWRQGWGRGFWSMFGYEHGFRYDESRRTYEDNAALGELVWYWRSPFSMRLEGRASRSTVNDLSHSALLEARLSF